VLPSIEYGENLEPVDSFFSAYFLGGLFRLSGLGTSELFGDEFLLARLLAYRRLFSFNIAGSGVRIYAGMSLEAGNVYFAGTAVSWDTMLKGGSIFVGGDTLIGPVIFAYGRTSGDYRTGGANDRFYFAIGDKF
jgi:NTE family protein